jgi:hypothetical protein
MVVAQRGHPELPHRHIKIELIESGAILHRIDDAHRGIDAKHGEILDEPQMMRLERSVVDQKFNLIPITRGHTRGRKPGQRNRTIARTRGEIVYREKRPAPPYSVVPMMEYYRQYIVAHFLSGTLFNGPNVT